MSYVGFTFSISLYIIYIRFSIVFCGLHFKLIIGSLRHREVACSASDRQGLNFESCVWRTVSSQSSHHTQEVLLAQFNLYVHKSGLKPDSFHLFKLIIYFSITVDAGPGVVVGDHGLEPHSGLQI